MDTIDIPFYSLLLGFLLLIVPVVLSRMYGLGLIRPIFSSAARMTVQLVLIGVFLKYLFLWNNALINLLWLIVMISVAVFSAVGGSSMKPGKIAVPVFVSFALATLSVVFYINIFVIRLDYVFDARYLVVLGGAGPEVAIKYQIMIMIGILVSTAISVLLTILMTSRVCFTEYGTLRDDVFA